MVTHIARVWINRVRLPILLVVSWIGKINIPMSAFVPENLVSRDGFGSPAPRQAAHLHTQAESGAYLRDSSRVPRRRSYIYLNRHTPSGQSRTFIESRNCVPMAFTAASPPAQGQLTSRWFRTSAALAGHHRPINIRLSFPHPLLVWSGYVESWTAPNPNFNLISL